MLGPGQDADGGKRSMSRLRSGTVGRRFTLLYAAGFLGSGIVLLALTYLMLSLIHI